MRKTAMLIATLALGLVFAGSASTMATPKLVGTDGPGFTITLKKGGVKVRKVKRGKYTFVINDKSAAHNFHLTGPGVNKKTTIGFVGKKTWTLTLKKGTYKYVCDPHVAQGMKGSFKVT